MSCPQRPWIEIDADKIAENIFEWEFFIVGAPSTIYENERFLLRFKFSKKYPFEAPIVVFVPPYLPIHPHVYSNGHICLSILNDEWTPSYSVESVCISILSMLSSCKEKALPPGDSLYVATAPKEPSKTGWVYHETDYGDYEYMTSVAEDTLDREEYSKFHLNLPDMSVNDRTSSSTAEQPDLVHDPLTDSHEVKRVKEVLKKEIPQDQFSEIHTDIMSQLVTLQKGQANLRSLKLVLN
ncbi:ubiquitin-conjugating enzyme E2 W-like isoform X2 [Artemia franciscana]